MSQYRKVQQKLAENKPVYLLNDFEDLAVRYDGRQWFLKFKGKPEKPAPRSGLLVNDTVLEAVEITQKDYEQY
jgi:hypothetical protein